MAIEETLMAIIEADAGVTGLVGKRIHANVAPQQGKLPCIVYQQIHGPRVYSHEGDSQLLYPRYQFSCWAKTYKEAKQVAEALASLLSGYSNRPDVQAIFVDFEQDTYDPEVKQHRAMIDFRVWHKW